MEQQTTLCQYPPYVISYTTLLLSTGKPCSVHLPQTNRQLPTQTELTAFYQHHQISETNDCALVLKLYVHYFSCITFRRIFTFLKSVTKKVLFDFRQDVVYIYIYICAIRNNPNSENVKHTNTHTNILPTVILLWVRVSILPNEI
jgi:hypothetical protein